MGALHDGHAALIRAAKRKAGRNGSVTVSIFVNPIQFGPSEDLDRYPRPISDDLEVCRREGVDLVFNPTPDAVYPDGYSVYVDETRLSDGLCGRTRPGHFRGVCTVVAKLFLLLRADAAVFGEKDWQQLAIIRKMCADLHLSTKIMSHPTARDPDGLAISSRNRYLTPDQRSAAPGIFSALTAASTRKTPDGILGTATRLLSAIPNAQIDYIELVDAESLAPIHKLDRPARLAAAVFLGNTRLIDNVPVAPRL